MAYTPQAGRALEGAGRTCHPPSGGLIKTAGAGQTGGGTSLRAQPALLAACSLGRAPPASSVRPGNPPPLTLSLRGSVQFRRQSLSSLRPGWGCCGQDVPPKHCVLLCGGGSSCLQQAGWGPASSPGRAPPASSVRPLRTASPDTQPPGLGPASLAARLPALLSGAGLVRAGCPHEALRSFVRRWGSCPQQAGWARLPALRAGLLRATPAVPSA